MHRRKHGQIRELRGQFLLMGLVLAASAFIAVRYEPSRFDTTTTVRFKVASRYESNGQLCLSNGRAGKNELTLCLPEANRRFRVMFDAVRMGDTVEAPKDLEKASTLSHDKHCFLIRRANIVHRQMTAAGSDFIATTTDGLQFTFGPDEDLRRLPEGAIAETVLEPTEDGKWKLVRFY